MAKSGAPMPATRGALQPLRREGVRTSPSADAYGANDGDDEDHSATTAHGLLQQVREDSVESIDKVPDVRPAPRRGTFGLAGPHSAGSGGRTTSSVTSSPVRPLRSSGGQDTDNQDADADNGEAPTEVHVGPMPTTKVVRPGPRSALYGQDDDLEDKNETEISGLKQTTSQSAAVSTSVAAPSKRRIHFEEREEDDNESNGAVEHNSRQKQQRKEGRDENDSGGQVKESSGKAPQKLKQRFHIKFGGKRQQPSKGDQQVQSPAEEVNSAEMSQSTSAKTNVTAKDKDLDEAEQPLEKTTTSGEVAVAARKPRFSLPKLGRARTTQQSLPPKVIPTADVDKADEVKDEEDDHGEAEDDDRRSQRSNSPPQTEGGKLETSKTADGVSRSAVEVGSKRRSLGFIPRLRGSRSSVTQDKADVKPTEPAGEDTTVDQIEDVSEAKSSGAETTETGRRLAFAAPWRRKKTIQEDSGTAAHKDDSQSTPAARKDRENQDFSDGEDDDEVKIITGSQNEVDSASTQPSDRSRTTNDQNALEEASTAEDTADNRESKPWSRFKFGLRRQRPQSHTKDQDPTTKGDAVDYTPSQRLEIDSDELQASAASAQRSDALAEEDARQSQRRQQHKQQQHQHLRQQVKRQQPFEQPPRQDYPTAQSPLQELHGYSHEVRQIDDRRGPAEGSGPETRVQVEQEVLADRAVVEEPEDDDQVFVSRLFVDRFLTRRRNAPLPSMPVGSPSIVRSVAAKPSAHSEVYGSCLARAGRVAQGLLAGLCLFLLLLLLAADDDEVKRIFGGSNAGVGGQAHLLQMVLYFLVIVSVIASFDGLNYQQMVAERRPNRFVFTSVIYPAILILGLTVTKLDNKLAYGGNVTSEEWARWKGVNLGRCACGLVAWLVVCI